MIGLKRGTVSLYPHQLRWEEEAAKTIALLQSLLGEAAIDIQHIGSTSIKHISAKPIIDLVVGVSALDSIKPHIPLLAEKGILFRKEDVKDQLLFVMGDFEKDTRTHHIHVVEWNSIAWHHYIHFRDYLNAHPSIAKEYNDLKENLASAFADDRQRYTAGKQAWIESALKEADLWKRENEKK